MAISNESAFFKVIIVGDGAIGKTSICTHVTTKEFFSNYNMTIGCDFFIKKMMIKGIDITLQIFDIGGQDHFAKLREAFVGGAKGVFLAFDITRRDSFVNLIQWLTCIEKEINPKAPRVLIATKTDLSEQAEVWDNDIQDSIPSLKFDAFYSTSAYTGVGVEEAFEMMGLLLLSRYEKEEYSKSSQKMRFFDSFYRGFKE